MSMHIPVLLKEAVDNLNIKEGDTIVDATLGNGGHSEEILKRLKNGKLVVIDFDSKAISFSKNKLSLLANKNNNKIIFIHSNFARLNEVLIENKIKKVDSILADLGWRSDQLEKLSFNQDEKLDMSLADDDRESRETLKLINYEKEDILNEIFKKFGEEKHSKLVAREISKVRKIKKITSNSELAKIINKAIGKYYKNRKINPATKVFQALRIKVNKELENLETFLKQSIEILNKDGRLVVISFHSLEDRIVKNFLKTNARGCVCPKELPICVCGKKSLVEIITRKPIIPSDKELILNKRSRSAKMRVARKK